MKSYNLAFFVLRHEEDSMSVAEKAMIDAPVSTENQARYDRSLVRVRGAELSNADILKPKEVAERILKQRGDLAKRVHAIVDNAILDNIEHFSSSDGHDSYLVSSLTDALNRWIGGSEPSKSPSLKQRKGKTMSDDVRALRALRKYAEANRLWLEDDFPGCFVTARQRDKVWLNKEQAVQKLTMKYCEALEKSREAAASATWQDLQVSFFKHIALESYYNAFKATVGSAMIACNFGRSNAMRIYDLIMQKKSEGKLEHHFTQERNRWIDGLKKRFGEGYVLETETDDRGTRVFKSAADNPDCPEHPEQWLDILALWMAPGCVNAEKWTVNEVPPEFNFRGSDYDKEHPVSQRRIHSLMHWFDFSQITKFLSLPSPKEKFRVPAIQSAKPVPANDDDDDLRLNPPPPDEKEIARVLRSLDLTDRLRKSPGPLGAFAVRVNGEVKAHFDEKESREVRFAVPNQTCDICVTRVCAEAPTGEITVVSHIHHANYEGDCVEVFTAELGKGKRLDFVIEFDESRDEFVVNIMYEPAASSATVTWWQAWLSNFSSPRLAWQLSLAVVAIGLLAGSWLIVETVRLRGRLAQIQEERAALTRREQELQAQLTGQNFDRERLANELQHMQEQRDQLERELQTLRQSESTLAFFVLTRGVRGSDTKDLTISSKITSVKLRLEFESDDYPAYRAMLKTQSDDKEVWASGRLKARQKGASKSVEVNIPARLLEARGYRLDLKAIKASGGEDDIRGYPFRIVKR